MTAVIGAGGIGLPGELSAGDDRATRTEEAGSLSFGELLGGALVASASAAPHQPAVSKPAPLSLDAGPAAIASAALQSGIIEFHDPAPTDALAAALRATPPVAPMAAPAEGSLANPIANPIALPSPGPVPPPMPAPTSFVDPGATTAADVAPPVITVPVEVEVAVEVGVSPPAPVGPQAPPVPPPAAAKPEMSVAIPAPQPAAIAAGIPAPPIDPALAAKPEETPTGPVTEAPVLAPRSILPVTPSSPLPGLYAGALRVRPAASTVPPLAQVPGAARPVAAHHPFAAGTQPSLSLDRPAEPGVEPLEPKAQPAGAPVGLDARIETRIETPAAHAPAHPAQSTASSSSADAKSLPDAAVDRTPPAEPEPPRSGELGPSSARVTVGEGESRVALWIAVRGESVRVEARAHNAAYADAINQRADELASGLADRGLQLGSMSADVAGDRTGQQAPEPQRDERRRSAEPEHPDDGPEPDRPRPRGVRAIA